MFRFLRIGSLGRQLMLSLPPPPSFLTKRVRWLSTAGCTTWYCEMITGFCQLVVAITFFCSALELYDGTVFLYCQVLLAFFSYLRMCTPFCFKLDLGSEQNTLQSPQEARSFWQCALASSALRLAILSCSVWEAWSVALPGAREVLMLLAVHELCICTVAALCYQDTEIRLATEPPHGQQFWTRPPPLQPRLFTSTLRAAAMVKLFAISRTFTFKPEEMKDPTALEIDGSELHQDMCTICLADFKVGDSATRLPCRHIFHSACIESWTLSMQGPFIGCPLRCETGRTSMVGQETPNHLIEDSGIPRG
ncbi:unnamed protein product [Polarella glacialis]|uniref:RING-type domain-containing protein n=1 Tax=Polarella glacialis TaxID=89957 RepID=A0A813L5P5_POLGL|nr:unnamed protein product [Polarella glacialis]